MVGSSRRDPEHVARLEQGVAAWNAWRSADPTVLPRLGGVDLGRRDLAGAHLEGADLGEADLGGANLVGARLDRANLSGAAFPGANLTLARLTGVDLRTTDLQGAILTRGTLDGSNLEGVDLSGCWMPGASFQEARLSGARMMESTLDGAVLDGAYLVQAEMRGATLNRARLIGAALGGAKLQGAELTDADLSGAHLRSARLSGADLRRAVLRGATLEGAELEGADLRDADLAGANLLLADLREARLDGARLDMANLVRVDLTGATLHGCGVYGISAWDVTLPAPDRMTDLRITPAAQPAVTVDNLEVAQFVYLVLHNEKIRDVIDTITGRGVLILGRFLDERKRVLDALRDRLREMGFVPIVFDWDKPTSRDLTETVQLLATLSRFVVADVTEARSIPQELSHIVPFLPSVPVRPIIQAGRDEYGLFEHWAGYDTMLPVHPYRDEAHLVEGIREALIEPVEAWEAGHDRERVLREEVARLRRENAALRGGAEGGGDGAPDRPSAP